MFPSCTLVALVVNGFVNCTTIKPSLLVINKNRVILSKAKELLAVRNYQTKPLVAVRFHDGADEILNHQGHEGSRRLLASDVSFVYLGGLGGERLRKLDYYQAFPPLH
jgi:hypothetical protein